MLDRYFSYGNGVDVADRDLFHNARMIQYSLKSEKSERSDFDLVFPRRLPPTYTFHFLDDATKKSDGVGTARIPQDQCIPSQSCPYPARMTSNLRVSHPSHYQEVRLIEFDISDSKIE